MSMLINERLGLCPIDAKQVSMTLLWVGEMGIDFYLKGFPDCETSTVIQLMRAGF